MSTEQRTAISSQTTFAPSQDRMSSSIIEHTREVHQQREELTQQVIEVMLADARSDRARIVRDTAARRALDELDAKNEQLLNLYDDADGTRAEELRAIGGENVFTEFYDRVRQTRDQHRRLASLKAASGVDSGNGVSAKVGSIRTPHDGGVVDAAAAAKQRMIAVSADSGFSPTESHGRFLDLQALHERFLNLALFHEAADATDSAEQKRRAAAPAKVVAAGSDVAMKAEGDGDVGGEAKEDEGANDATAKAKAAAAPPPGRSKTRVSYLRYLTLFYKLDKAAPVEAKLRRHYTAYQTCTSHRAARATPIRYVPFVVCRSDHRQRRVDSHRNLMRHAFISRRRD